MKNRLRSRKFWATVATIAGLTATTLAGGLPVPQAASEIVMALMAYLAAQGVVDAASAIKGNRPTIPPAAPFLVAALLIASAATAAEPIKLCPTGTTATVTRIVDGDTLDAEIDGQIVTVRLAGVDTPESVHPRKPVEPGAIAASAYVKACCENRQVLLKPDSRAGTVDRYGRALAYVHGLNPPFDLNAEIIHKGFGRHYEKYPCDRSPEFTIYQSCAQLQRRGIWRLEPSPWTP